MRQAPLVRNHRENNVNKEVLEIVGNGKLTCSEGDNCSFRHDMNKRAKSTQPNPSPRSSTQQSVKNASRTRSPRGRTQVGKWLDCRARIGSKELAPLHSVKKWHLPECLFHKTENGCRFGEKCSDAHRQVDVQPGKRSEKNGDKSAVATLQITRQFGCVFQDMEPPKSTTILRKSSNILKPIRCVRFTEAVVLGMICPGDPHQRTPMCQNLRIGLRKRRNGKSDVPVKQRGGLPKIY